MHYSTAENFDFNENGKQCNMGLGERQYILGI
jgi:hypothetical protein